MKTWAKRSAEELVLDAEKRKEGKAERDFLREFRPSEIGDLITLLIAGGQLITHNQDSGTWGYDHIVNYKGYSFRGHTLDQLADGILNRDYTSVS